MLASKFQQIPKDWQQRLQDPLRCLEIGAGTALPSLCDMAKNHVAGGLVCLNILSCLKSPSFCPVLLILKTGMKVPLDASKV